MRKHYEVWIDRNWVYDCLTLAEAQKVLMEYTGEEKEIREVA